MSVLIGMNFYAAQGDAGRRQDRAIAALRALRGTPCVNLQWPDGRFDVPGIETLATLRRDARTVTGRDGRRKPIVPDMLDILADAASARGCLHFLFANADIEITPAAIALIDEAPRDGYAFVRTDLDPETHASIGQMRYGVDAFAFDVRWWGRNRHRFRAYIAGEPVWDNVYTAILLTHSDAAFVDREGLVLHERHESPWRDSPYDDYTWYLAALDRPYFSLWSTFHAEFMALGAAGVGADAVDAMRDRLFDASRLGGGRVVQFLRAAKARARYAMHGLRRP